MHYPRDLIGYGELPQSEMAGESPPALQPVINYEEGENCILHGDAASEAFLSEIIGAQALPGMRHTNMESTMSTAVERALAVIPYFYGAPHARYGLWGRLCIGQEPGG